ncbi:T9SS type A sorting domain-containing protein [Hymenobacter persicinus]|uniref:T9SS type A sorting domain-containing protein n=1 Tax=Hymenobacter persicinus TaxID=2025506 RepID=A0A4Q5LBP4_9BACT|nr:T9SS type A sorting domain-containing protein [Hymenobacter persicinus]RYU78493.1 T9SS type A sorting domain-containing protein [Hymenobacter persicinus]
MINFILPRFLRLSKGGLVAMLLWLATTVSFAQAPAWQAAIAAGQTGGNAPAMSATAADAAGNVYLTGSFQGTVVFGSLTLTSAGSEDVFVVKWSSAARSFVWALRAGGPGQDIANAIAVRGTSIYIAGNFRGATAMFGNSVLTNVTSNNLDPDIFVAKLTDTGPMAYFDWAKRAGGTESDYAHALAVNGSSVYVVGEFYSQAASFGATVLSNVSNNNFGGDVYVAKLLDQGTSTGFVWAQQAGGLDYDYGQGVVADGSSVYVTGYFYSSAADFGTTTLTNANTASNNTTDAYVAKLTDAGSTASFQWAQRAGGLQNEYANAIGLKGPNVYVTGTFESSTASFGSYVLANAAGTGTSDIFVAKVVDTGTTAGFAWAQQAGGVGNDYANGIGISGTSIYVSGGFKDPISFPALTTLTSAGLYDVFLAKVIDSGSSARFDWVQQGGSTGDDSAKGVAVGGKQLHLIGAGPIPLVFGSRSIQGIGRVGFLASLTDNTILATAPAWLEETTVYPNPGHDQLAVMVPGVATESQVAMQLTDLLGRVVYRTSAALPSSGLRHYLDVSTLKPGFYSLRIQVGTSYTVRKLTID